MLVQDNHGNGRPAGFAFLHHENKLSVQWALKQFQDAVTTTAKTKVIFVDKDFVEISAVASLFPGVDVLLCQFHVVKYLKKVIADLSIEISEKAELLSLFKLVMHSATQVLL